MYSEDENTLGRVEQTEVESIRVCLKSTKVEKSILPNKQQTPVKEKKIMTNKERIERQKMIVCMEYICRQINDESVLDGWLRNGVPDGDIEYGNLDPTQVYEEDYMITDGFSDIMTCFLRRMSSAYKNGGLWCGGVLSGTKEG